MKSYLKRTLTALGVMAGAFLLSTVIAACNGSAEADTAGGVSQAAFNALKATVADQADAIAALQTQVEALQSGSDSALKAKLANLYVTIDAPNAQGVSRDTQSYGDSSGGIQTMTVADTCSGLGTLTGHPNSSDPRTSDKLAGVSCTGYLFTVKAAPTSSDSSHVLPFDGSVFFSQPNCQGTAYISPGRVSKLAVANGMVFALKGAEFNDDWANTAYYRMLPPNPQTVQIAPASHWDQGECQKLLGGVGPAYPTQMNDPNVTGVPSGLIPGPVGMGTVQ